jgi:hypothetical protein
VIAWGRAGLHWPAPGLGRARLGCTPAAAASACAPQTPPRLRRRPRLQAQFLQPLFLRALDVARSTAASGAAQQGADAGACAAAMRLMCSVLGWGFRGGGGATALPNGARRAGAEAAAALRPGQAWADVLLPEASTGWLLALLPALRGAAAGGALAGQARALVVAFCSLAGDVFPRPAPGEAAAPAAAAHCARMLRAAAPWVSPARAAVHQAAVGDEAELVDGCR